MLQHSMVYFFHHYEIPAVVQQSTVHHVEAILNIHEHQRVPDVRLDQQFFPEDPLEDTLELLRDEPIMDILVEEVTTCNFNSLPIARRVWVVFLET